ncbi:hypothetical protein [Methylobacterium sp. E-066]|uniref:hypothetical protein n=1 Tax=Methylobacterium sp. E-066 TaxID=2836584 RepID=UPI001FBC0A7F|nr:hypothetical protein [Methylobacterium sp. E-066]MCJ2139113.1 hypothetical protein [Methylobacterium sp. E-066]
MRRLVQPGWILFQLAVVGFFVWVAATVQTDQPRQYGVMVVAGVFTAYALTVALLILNEGRKDALRWWRRRHAISVSDGHGASEDLRPHLRRPGAREIPPPAGHHRL